MSWFPLHTHQQNKVLICVFVLGIVFGNVSYLISTYDPLEMLVDEVLKIRPNSFAFKLWEYPPYEVLGKLYLFNVTNYEEFLSGEENLTFNEVGPYVYREILFNSDVNFEDNGTMTFVPRRKLVFVPELSVGDPSIDTLLLPSVPLLGLTSALDDYSIFIKMAVSQISFAINAQPLVNITVDQYLFGYQDDLVSLGNNVLPNWIDFTRFGIIERLMALDNDTHTINMPIDSCAGTLYTIQNLNGVSGLPQWSANTECNGLENFFTGIIFPRNLEKTTPIVLYRHGFCIPLPIRFNRSDTKYGFETYTYQIDKNFLHPKKDSARFCSKSICLPKGVGYITPCYYDIPLALSLPHFLNADPITREPINGMNPEPDKHNFYMVISPQSGLPIEAKLRVQINLQVTDTKFNYRTKPFNNLLLPLFWIDLSVDGPPTLISLLLILLFTVLPLVQTFFKYVLVFLSAVFTAGSTLIFVCAYIRKYRKYGQLNVSGYGKIQKFGYIK